MLLKQEAINCINKLRQNNHIVGWRSSVGLKDDQILTIPSSEFEPLEIDQAIKLLETLEPSEELYARAVPLNEVNEVGSLDDLDDEFCDVVVDHAAMKTGTGQIFIPGVKTAFDADEAVYLLIIRACSDLW